MERRHWAPDHPAVMAWAEARHKRSARYVELSVAQRRRAVVARHRASRKTDSVKSQAVVGLTLMVLSGFVFDHAEKVGGGWWLATGCLLGGGGSLVVDAIRKAN